MALAHDGSLYAWGERVNRPPGKENASNCVIPTAVQVGAAPAGTHFVHISAGGGHCFAIANDGTVYAWGLNNFGYKRCLAGFPSFDTFLLLLLQ